MCGSTSSRDRWTVLTPSLVAVKNLYNLYPRSNQSRLLKPFGRCSAAENHLEMVFLFLSFFPLFMYIVMFQLLKHTHNTPFIRTPGTLPSLYLLFFFQVRHYTLLSGLHLTLIFNL